jgi:hypothetical protein
VAVHSDRQDGHSEGWQHLLALIDEAAAAGGDWTDHERVPELLGRLGAPPSGHPAMTRIPRFPGSAARQGQGRGIRGLLYLHGMMRTRWLGRIAAATAVLVAAAISSTPVAAAPCSSNCATYTYLADISVTAPTFLPGYVVTPGSQHTFTATVTNSGVRISPISAPQPTLNGPASGVVYVAFDPTGPAYETPIGCWVAVGNPSQCQGSPHHGLFLDLGSIPANASWQLAATFQAPMLVGQYSMRIWAYPFPGPHPWTEFDADNDSITLTYQVAYQP